MENKKEEPVNHVFNPNVKFELTLQELSQIQQVLEPLAFAASILDAVKQKVASIPGNMFPVYENDLVNEPGVGLTLRKSFWEKHLPKEPSKSLNLETVDQQVVQNN